MILLRREISPYTDEPLFIGLFRTLEEALEAKNHYIFRIESGELTDKWREQAYQSVDLVEDIQTAIITNDIDTKDSRQVFLVVETFEGFGQIVVTPKGVFDSHQDALQFAAGLMSESKDPSWPGAIGIAQFEVGRTYISHQPYEWV